MALNRAETACLHRHVREWRERIADEEITQEQIDAVREALKSLAKDMGECDPHTVMTG